MTAARAMKKPRIGDRVQCKCAPGCARCWHDGRPCCVRGRVVGGPSHGDMLIEQEFSGERVWATRANLVKCGDTCPTCNGRGVLSTVKA